MGIQGLLPLLKSIQLPISISELSGNTVGVDAYCWLHKGVYGCALQLAEGKESDVYINYVMHRVNMMLYYNIKPIMVFDGGYLPSKREKETERREKRKENRTQGLAYLKSGNRTKALECFQKSIDISPEMAYNVIKACRAKDVDCIVAPYEADAQLAYLMKAGITQFTISEDSDLLVYGCDKVVFKMDANGSGLLINIKNLPKLSALRMDGFTEKKFREMCILSGCDYLQSVKGMGLITAHKLLRKHSTVNKLIGTLRLNNKMKVPQNYETRFAQAEQTFLYQIVFDPNTNKLIPLNPIPDDLDSTQLHFAGHNGMWTQEDAVELALGNLNPITGKKIGTIKVSEVISQVANNELLKTKKFLTTSLSSSNSQSNASLSVLPSSGEYEAKRNLNGTFKETKSSEKTNQPFVTPVRTKRSRSETGDNVSDSSRLAKLYCGSDIVGDGNYDDQNEDKHVVEQPKKRPKNPFRSPVINGKQQPREHVVSRYFGLAGMETTEEMQCDDNTLNKTNINRLNECDSHLGSEIPTSQDCFNDQKSDHFQPQNIATSPPEYSSKLLTSNDTTPRSSKTRNCFVRETKMRAKATSAHGKNRNSENCEPQKKKIKSSQASLDKFAFVKNCNKVNVEKTKMSPHRSVLGSFSENCQIDRTGEPDANEVENEENCGKINSEFTKILDNEIEDEHRNGFEETQERSRILNDVDHESKPKQIVLHTKPTTGLSRCRPVGLSRPKPREKKKTGTEHIPTLMKYFAYRGRSSQAVIT